MSPAERLLVDQDLIVDGGVLHFRLVMPAEDDVYALLPREVGIDRGVRNLGVVSCQLGVVD